MGWLCEISNVSIYIFSCASTYPLRGRWDRKNRFGVVEHITHVRSGSVGPRPCLYRLEGRSTMPDRARMGITILALSLPC